MKIKHKKKSKNIIDECITIIPNEAFKGFSAMKLIVFVQQLKQLNRLMYLMNVNN